MATGLLVVLGAFVEAFDRHIELRGFRKEKFVIDIVALDRGERGGVEEIDELLTWEGEELGGFTGTAATDDEDVLASCYRRVTRVGHF